MSFLNSKARNRKRRGRKKTSVEKTNSSWIHDGSAPSKDHHKLNAQIGVLEDFLAGRAREVVHKDQMRRNNILPPPETFNKQRARRRMSTVERRQYLAERNRGGLSFLFLFCLSCGIIWWLLKSGI